LFIADCLFCIGCGQNKKRDEKMDMRTEAQIEALIGAARDIADALQRIAKAYEQEIEIIEDDYE
tara:strand:+ start:1236 stop:1427 length:192 start_codon:yes stop_codon:yes gene_type:complete